MRLRYLIIAVLIGLGAVCTLVGFTDHVYQVEAANPGGSVHTIEVSCSPLRRGGDAISGANDGFRFVGKPCEALAALRLDLAVGAAALIIALTAGPLFLSLLRRRRRAEPTMALDSALQRA